MEKIGSRAGLARVLSTIKPFEDKKVKEEQYQTDSEIAASIVFDMVLKTEPGKVIDLGCGNGILGLGALLLGAKEVYFVDNDKEALLTAQENYEIIKAKFPIGKAVFIDKNINELNLKERFDCVIENPPFGTKTRHIDSEFLKKAFSLAPIVYSFHKTNTKEFIVRLAEQNEFKVIERFDFMFPIKKQFSFHTKPKKFVDVSCFRLEKA